AERRRQRDGGRVAAAAAKRGDFAPVGHTLIAGDDNDAAAGEFVLHAKWPDLDDAGVDVPIVGDDARLAAGEADGIAAQIADGDREPRPRDELARADTQVRL